MTDQIQVADTAQNIAVSAAATYLAASVGHFKALCELAYATALMQRERSNASQPELSAGTAAERATVAFEEALNASGKVTAKTVDNICRTMRKGVAFAITRMQKDKTLYTLDLSADLFGAEFERLDGFKPNLRDIDAAISAANGTARKGKDKKASSEASETASQEAVTIKADATAAAKWTGLTKAVAAMFADPENHALILADDSFRDVVALYVKLSRESAEGEGDQRQAA